MIMKSPPVYHPTIYHLQYNHDNLYRYLQKGSIRFIFNFYVICVSLSTSNLMTTLKANYRASLVITIMDNEKWITLSWVYGRPWYWSTKHCKKTSRTTKFAFRNRILMLIVKVKNSKIKTNAFCNSISRLPLKIQ